MDVALAKNPIAMSIIKRAIKKIVLFSIRIFFHCSDILRYYSIHQFKSRIKVIIPEKSTENGDYDTLAIFAIYQPKGLSALIKRSINYLSVHKIKILMVAPHPLNQVDINFLQKNHCIILTRENFGRDFASYKYGVLYLLDNLHLLEPFKKVLLVNDSIIFPLKEQDNTLAQLLTYSQDVIGLAEGYVDHWHMGSYFILFQKEFFLDQNLQKFWRRYKPYSSRYYCINRGEIILSQTILKCAYPHKKIRLVYENRKLLHAIEKSVIADKMGLFRFTQLINDSLLIEEAAHVNLNLKQLSHFMEKLSLVHYFSLALIEYLACFFIKRDLCFREILTISQLLHYIASINENEDFIEQISLDLKHKGKISSLPFFKKILTNAAII
jgi:Rhamnan synthesis protein F